MSDQPATFDPHPLANEDLVRFNRAILVAAVVRGTVHSVNNILQTIGGQAEMLSQRPEPADEVRRRAERISTQTGRAAGHMRELSALIREVPMAPDRVDVRVCVDRVIALRDYDLQKARITFDAGYDTEPLPAARIDLPALLMILLNLVLNAEHALTTVQDARIELRVSAADGWLTMVLRDNGPGIAADRRERLFDAFDLAGTAPGLGLRVSRYLAEEHGGRLTLADAPTTTGASFVLELPALA